MQAMLTPVPITNDRDILFEVSKQRAAKWPDALQVLSKTCEVLSTHTVIANNAESTQCCDKGTERQEGSGEAGAS